jgi:hypothetical protein
MCWFGDFSSMCWFGDFALDHTNTLSEVQGAFIRYNPNHMKLLEQPNWSDGWLPANAFGLPLAECRRRERLDFASSFCKRRDE